MAKGRHTGGEDAVWEADGRDVVCVLGGARVVVARVPGSVAPDEREPNARLMAAAPLMLRVMRALVQHEADFGGSGSRLPAPIRSLIDDAIDSIEEG